jgi:hypothetical protein
VDAASQKARSPPVNRSSTRNNGCNDTLLTFSNETDSRTKEGPDTPALLRGVEQRAVVTAMQESALGVLAIFGLVLDLFADLLHILARTRHGIASGQRAHHEHRNYDQCQ